MHTRQRILIAPLDWGLGHASRCVPIIRLLLKKGAEVIIAADGRPMELLKQEFPTLEFVRLKGYEIYYPERGSMILKMFSFLPRILSGIRAEHNALKKIIKEKRITIVISDNRFGLWNDSVKCIFITHQLMIKTPFAEKLLHKINLHYINKFDECWIPDAAGEINLSGDLSHKYPLPRNACFIGALSRFDIAISSLEKKDIYDIVAIISGPEPQRTLFEKMISEQIIKSDLKALIVCGKTEERSDEMVTEKVRMVSHLNTEEMKQAIIGAKIIVARSGYTTLMDMARLGKKAIFIPTPGQTEQLYLAERLMKEKIAFSQQQHLFNLQQAIIESENYRGLEIMPEEDELEKRIDALKK